MSALDVDTVIVGAGPSGLAVAGCLTQAGLSFTLLEREASVGASWRKHYDRLHLHTARALSSLPHLPMPPDYPTYPSRDEVVAYLDNYQRALGIEPRLGVEVTRATRAPDGRWHVTAAGEAWNARNLVVASGYNAAPTRPTWPGLDTFPGRIIHSSEYKNGRDLAGLRVLVVGAGNSGAEIAVDLWESKAEVAIAIRGPLHVAPRDAFGLPAQHFTLALSHLPVRLADKLSEPLRDLVIGDLSPWGIVRPPVGPLELLETTGRVPLVDIGTVALIKQGAITVVPGLAELDGATVTFVDGRQRAFDALILATGYRAGLGWLDADCLDERGLPRAHGREAAPGLYFLGYRNPTTGNLREIALEAQRIADALAKQRPAASAEPRTPKPGLARKALSALRLVR